MVLNRLLELGMKIYNIFAYSRVLIYLCRLILFVKCVGPHIVILLLYVDDIIIIGSSNNAITKVIDVLSQELDLKDLGALHYFLGIQIIQNALGLFLS